MTSPDVVLGVDIGTSSTKGVLVTLSGEVLHSVVRQHDVQRPSPGQVEMDGAVWWAEFREISAELAEWAQGASAPIVAIGVSGMGPCLLLTDAKHVPLRPAILYGVDTRAGVQIAEINARLGADAIFERCGSALSSQALGPKLEWIKAQEPAVWARARYLFMPASWLAMNLTGEYGLDHQSASQCTPLYDTHALAWHAPWADELRGPVTLPRLLWPGEKIGSVTAQAAHTTGLPEGIPVIMGTIDAWSEALSVGAHKPGDLMLMYGTTMFLINTTSRRVTHPALWGTVGAVPGTWNFAAGMATSGAITGWLRGLFGSPDFAQLLADAAASPPGSRGLLMLPYFAGERTPISDPSARGTITGLTVEHTRGDLYRAALEATAFGIRHNVEQMRAAGAVISRIVAVGGGTQNGLWPQIVSDVTGLVQEIPHTTVGASLGAAFLAAGLVSTPNIDQWNPVEVTVTPNPDLAMLYDEIFADYLALYPATREIAHRRAALQARDSRHPLDDTVLPAPK